MVDIEIQGDTAVFVVEGLDKLWSLKSRLEIPLRHIRGVNADPVAGRGWWKGWKLAGARLPGVIKAGSFRQDGQRVFWDVHDPSRAIVLELADENFKELIVEVASPEAAVAMLNQALQRETNVSSNPSGS